MNRRSFCLTWLGVLVGMAVVPDVVSELSAQQWQGPGGLKIKKQGGQWYITGNRHRIEDVEWAVRHIDQDLALAESRPTIIIRGIEFVYPRKS